ncbi:MAG: beta-lactamase family protein, partial [Calditrichia bacterium]|nr:beta-lactamase family protein [Calditrichia bacterium]
SGLKLWAPSYMPVAQKAVYDSLWGKFIIEGTLPATLSPQLKAGHQIIKQLSKKTISFNKCNNDKLQNLLEKNFKQKAFTGATAFSFNFNNNKIDWWSYGKAKNIRRKLTNITEDSIFDLASLTKIFSTTLITLHLISTDKLLLNDKISKFFVNCPKEKQNITIQQLLTHTAGIKSWFPLYEKNKTSQEAVKAILNLPLENKPGETVNYSDLGFIVLGRIIEYILDKPVSYAFRDIIAIPLNIENDVFFLSPQKTNDSNDLRLIASNSDWETSYNYLEFINDQNARLFPSGAGHAGLFGSIKGLSKIAELILNNGIWQDKIIIKPEIMKKSFEVLTAKDGSQRALGWDITGENTQAGKYFSNNQSRGHLAYTGCAFWFNPKEKNAALFLANRSFTGFS